MLQVQDKLKVECEPFLDELEQHGELVEPFLEPVDWKKWNMTEYPKVVKNPMDLGTVRKRLRNLKYNRVEEFAADIKLVWHNAKIWNDKNSVFYKSVLCLLPAVLVPAHYLLCLHTACCAVKCDIYQMCWCTGY